MAEFIMPSGHAALIAQFMNRPEGRSLKAYLASRRPTLGNATTIEHQALVSRDVKGYEMCLEEMESAANDRPVDSLKPTNGYQKPGEEPSEGS